MGHEVYNLDLDAQGRVTAVQQAMEPAVFDRIVPGRWSRQDVLQTFGKPALVETVARFDGDVWTYRYLDFYTPWMLHISLDRAGVVRAVQRFEEFPVRGADNGSFP
jgi:outer membrane protein assembly factor BamE (lipoprotein component of BamABCDE complex)